MSLTDEKQEQLGFKVFIASMLASLGLLIYLSFLGPGVSSLDQIQEIAAESEEPEFDVEEAPQPWMSSPEMVLEGKKVYAGAGNCASCHGPQGKAGIPGIAARNLIEGKWRNGGSSVELFKTLVSGIEGTSMVSFKDSLSTNQRWALVHFIRSITDNKPDDNPAELSSFGEQAL